MAARDCHDFFRGLRVKKDGRPGGLAGTHQGRGGGLAGWVVHSWPLPWGEGVFLLLLLHVQFAPGLFLVEYIRVPPAGAPTPASAQRRTALPMCLYVCWESACGVQVGIRLLAGVWVGACPLLYCTADITVYTLVVVGGMYSRQRLGANRVLRRPSGVVLV